MFTDEQKGELWERYQLHPILYDKTKKEYKNDKMTKCILEQKGITLTPKCTTIYIYYSKGCKSDTVSIYN